MQDDFDVGASLESASDDEMADVYMTEPRARTASAQIFDELVDAPLSNGIMINVATVDEDLEAGRDTL